MTPAPPQDNMNNLIYTPKLSLGIDEFTLVLQYIDKVDCMDWLEKVDAMIEEFISLSQIESLLGKLVTMYDKKPAGYTNALKIDDTPYYFSIAWHEDFQRMGVCIKFSAHALAVYMTEYEKQYQERITVSDFLKMIQSDIYSTRLSRIDMTADYKNYGYDLYPNTVYEKLKNNDYAIVNYELKHRRLKLSALERDCTVETFYAGARTENTNSFLRCYDKKKEQIEKHGFRMDEAKNCTSWTRFEVSFRGKYAHQITESLLKEIHTPLEMQQFIAQKIAEKFLFFDIASDDITSFSDDLLGAIGNNQFSYLRKETPRDNALRQSISHLLCGSGLFPTLFKVCQIWGQDAEKELLQYLYEVYQNRYKPDAINDKELRIWLKKHMASLQKQKLQDSF